MYWTVATLVTVAAVYFIVGYFAIRHVERKAQRKAEEIVNRSLFGGRK